MDCVACLARCPNHTGPSSAPRPPPVPQMGLPCHPPSPPSQEGAPGTGNIPFLPYGTSEPPPGPESPGPAGHLLKDAGSGGQGGGTVLGNAPLGGQRDLPKREVREGVHLRRKTHHLTALTKCRHLEPWRWISGGRERAQLGRARGRQCSKRLGWLKPTDPS